MPNYTKKQKEVAVSLQNVTKTFSVPHEKRQTIREHFFSFFRKNPKDDFIALDHISFDIYKGEFFGILGRNGSGKSTLLKLIAKIYQPDHGSLVIVNGTLSAFLELGVGFNMELTARENIYMNATILGLSRKEIDEVFDEIVTFAELEEFVDQKLKYFSSGMQVRLAFSVAIRADADIFLLDEVLAVGDSRFQAKCFQIFRELKKQKKTIIFVSHDLTAIRQFCDRAAYIKDSQLEAVGTPSDLIEQYLYTDKQEIIESEVKNENIDLNKQRTEFNTGIEITSVEFVDKFGKTNTNFLSQDPLSIKITLTSKINLDDPIIGLVIYDEQGTYLFGVNNQIVEKPIAAIKKGSNTYSINFPSITLLQGVFFVTLAVTNTNYTRTYDWREKSWSFTVKNTGNELGILTIPYSFDSHG